ncbi:MAG: protoporphyrinogen IX oxidase [Crocinitomicaceae bacterium]|nr:protoporphyrinogen IX oxidase [Crocinitomicaceae bacterium]|tara:strand:- start:426 stop:968 length:543 start_codon:yes stop_codon:yes gene_type:complete
MTQDSLEVIKALHIIFVVTWFAGLFYIVRLFIYQREAQDKPERERAVLTEQFKLMSKRLWLGITWPSAIITAILGPCLLYDKWSYYLAEPWMHTKLGFVVLLYLYHFACHIIYKDMQKDYYGMSSMGLRIWNELATLFLFAIVFLVVCKNFDALYLGTGLIALAVALMVGIKIYKKRRGV